MLRSILTALILLAVTAALAFAQSGANVLVIANKTSADSLRVAEQYARARGVPQDQVLRIDVAAGDELERAAFERQVQAPIVEWLGRHAAHDRILYIVLTRGVPLRIKGTGGRGGSTASVDSELALLYRRLTGTSAAVSGSLPNPYYLGAGPVAQAKRFSHAECDIFLVTRLDGYTVDDALALIDRASKPSREGIVVLDQKAGFSDSGGDQWLKTAADWLTAHGFEDRVLLEQTSRVVSGVKNVLGYYSWGSNDPAMTVRHLDLGFVPGALAGTFVSTDARTFREPPAGWAIGPWKDASKFFAGSPQSLIGDLVRDGVTGVSGSVAEPFLDGTVRPNALFPAYLSGFNLAESFYLATPYLSWQTVIVGDPLCAPFPRVTLQPSEIDKGIDPATEMPLLFSARRVRAASAAAPGVKPEAIAAWLRSEARTAKGDADGTLKALEEASAIDTRLTVAHLLLAARHEQTGEHDLARERYQKILTVNPNDPIALNNLAYSLAVRKGQPAEALGYAERAYARAPSPTIGDTLGWIQHLLGRDKEAAPLLADAARRLPDNAEVRLHAAVVFAAIGMLEAAGKELADAVRLDPTLENHEATRALRTKLKRP